MANRFKIHIYPWKEGCNEKENLPVGYYDLPTSELTELMCDVSDDQKIVMVADYQRFDEILKQFQVSEKLRGYVYVDIKTIIYYKCTEEQVDDLVEKYLTVFKYGVAGFEKMKL